jgi:hypothetical protein
MSRTSRIPYHQNVYDLLGIEPGESPEAARMIAEHEAKHGPLPASVREWYLVPNVVPLTLEDMVQPEPLLSDRWVFSPAPPLVSVLTEFMAAHVAILDRVCFLLQENRTSWYFACDQSDDPAVLYQLNLDDRDSHVRDSETFSDFLARWFAREYDQLSLPRALRKSRGLPTKPYRNKLWLRSASEPFPPPVIDFLTDHFGEPERASRPGNVTTYAYRSRGGTIRVTADEPTLTGGLSAWWVHADTPERLAEFAALLLPWGTLRDTLRADTDPARAVLKRVRAA